LFSQENIMIVEDRIAETRFAVLQPGWVYNTMYHETLMIGEREFEIVSEKSAEPSVFEYANIAGFKYRQEECYVNNLSTGVNHKLALLLHEGGRVIEFVFWDQPTIERQRSFLGFMQNVPVTPPVNAVMQLLVDILTNKIVSDMAEQYQNGEDVFCHDGSRAIATLNQDRIQGGSPMIGWLTEIPLAEVTAVRIPRALFVQIEGAKGKIGISLEHWNTLPFATFVSMLTS
jgi:hypothetical protein